MRRRHYDEVRPHSSLGFCKQGTLGDRLSRHWHDLVRMDDAGYAEESLGDRALAKDIADAIARWHC